MTCIVPDFVQRSLNLATNYFEQGHIGEVTFRKMYDESSGEIKVIRLNLFKLAQYPFDKLITAI